MDSLNYRAPLSAHKRANAAIIMLCMFLLYQGLVLIMSVVEFVAVSSAVSSGDYTGDGMGAVMALKGLLGLGHALLFVATGVVVLMWVHRAHRVLVDRNIPDLEFTPAWAVGWFFIPVANLFRPYLAVKEIWDKSDPQALQQPEPEPEPETTEPPLEMPAGLEGWPAKKSHGRRKKPEPPKTNPWMAAWWLGWVIGGGLDVIASVAFQRATNIILYYGALKMAFLSDVVFAATTALLIVVISKIDNRQRNLGSRLVRPPAPTPDPTPNPTPVG